MNPNEQLTDFLAPYSPAIQDLTMQLRNFIVDLVPETNELIWDNYNAVVNRNNARWHKIQLANYFVLSIAYYIKPETAEDK